MSVTILKHKQAGSEVPPINREEVQHIMADVRERGDDAIHEWAAKTNERPAYEIHMLKELVLGAVGSLPQNIIDDIRFAQGQYRLLAEEQMTLLQQRTEVETENGYLLGHKHVPVERVGCYVQQGYPGLVRRAAMGLVAAKAAGVKHITVCIGSETRDLPETLVAELHYAGADAIYLLSGVPAIGAMAYGALGMEPVQMIIGMGDATIMEAKQQVASRVNTALLHPMETAYVVLADDGADVAQCAASLVQPLGLYPVVRSVFVTTSQQIADALPAAIDSALAHHERAEAARHAWEQYGEILLGDGNFALVQAANQHKSANVTVYTGDPQYFFQRLNNYESISLNHTDEKALMPNYNEGFWVGNFIKTVTYQQQPQKIFA